jgi:hypothetical protein
VPSAQLVPAPEELAQAQAWLAAGVVGDAVSSESVRLRMSWKDNDLSVR